MGIQTAGHRAELAVVVRHTQHDERFDAAARIALMRAFVQPELADREAVRLNAVRRDASIQYFVKILRVDDAVLRDIGAT